MGLTSHKTGVKNQLKERFPSAFKKFPTLIDARNAASAQRENTVIHVDGNVIFMSVPQAARTLDAYLAVVFNSLRAAIATAFLTVVVFDDPDALTIAKRQEQLKRDAYKASNMVHHSSDLQSSPLDDNYDKQYVYTARNVHDLVGNRRTRLRFFDEIAYLLLDKLNAQIQRWTASGHTGGHVVFDGIDPRGADRPIGTQREPVCVASSPEAAALFKRETPIGEGDLKLADLGRRAREMARQPDSMLADFKLALCTTIDTDSFCLELIEEARRGESDTTPLNTVLCMRERAQKRGTEDEVPSYYLCCDVALLHNLLQKSMWGATRNPTARDQRAAITLLVSGWAACGCDFVQLKGMRSDVVFGAVAEIVKTQTDCVEFMKHAWSAERENLVKTHHSIRKLLVECASRLSNIPRIKKDCLPSISDPDDLILKRIGWVAAYWNSVEHKGVEDFGFLVPFA
jgi:hypothetical protein